MCFVVRAAALPTPNIQSSTAECKQNALAKNIPTSISSSTHGGVRQNVAVASRNSESVTAAELAMVGCVTWRPRLAVERTVQALRNSVLRQDIGIEERLPRPLDLYSKRPTDRLTQVAYEPSALGCRLLYPVWSLQAVAQVAGSYPWV